MPRGTTARNRARRSDPGPPHACRARHSPAWRRAASWPPIAAGRLHLAERDLRQPRMLDDVIDAGRAAEHGLQIREGGELVEIRMHEGEVVDVVQLARIRPDADWQIGNLLPERVAPSLRIA